MFRRFRIAVPVDTTVVSVCNLHLYLLHANPHLVGFTHRPQSWPR